MDTLTSPAPDAERAVRLWLEDEDYVVSTRAGGTLAGRHAYHGAWHIATLSNTDLSEVALAFYRASALAEADDREGARVGLALSRAAEQGLRPIRRALARLGIALLWVEPQGTIVLEDADADEGLRPEQLDASNDD